jgi:hypothetical protein
MTPDQIHKLKKIRKLVNELLGDVPVIAQDGIDDGSGDPSGGGGGPGTPPPPPPPPGP